MSTEKIFKFTSPDYFPRKYVGDYKWRIRQTNRLIFYDCKPLDMTKTYDLIVQVETSAEKILKYDVLPNNLDTPFIKGKALEILQDLCGDALQMFETVVETTDGPVHEYKALNLLREIENVNYEQSEMTYFVTNGKISGFNKLVMHAGAMAGQHMGRLKDMCPWILVSETLQKAFTKAKIKGVKFEEITVI